MYLVELRPGKEELYRSVDELAAAIRRGDVDMHSRIFHRATSKWISITLHPQFRAIAAADTPNVAPPPQQDWTFLTSAADALDQAPPPTVDLGAGIESEAPAASSPEPVTDASPGAWRRPFTLGIAGLFVLIGAQVAFSAPRPERSRLGFGGVSRNDMQRPSVEARVSESPSVVSLASTAGLGQIGYPILDVDVQQAPVPVVVPPAPAVHLSNFDGPRSVDVAEEGLSVETLMRRYDAAYEEAREHLASGIRVVQLSQLFAPASAGGVAELRMSMAGATNFVHAYQTREAEIERSHQDTFAVLSRQLAWPAKDIRRWYARTSHKESRAVAMLTEPLLASVDSVLTVLASNAGGYRVTGRSITFYQPEAMAEYRRLRQAVEGYLASAAAETEAGRAGSDGAMALLTEAIGVTRLPVEASS